MNHKFTVNPQKTKANIVVLVLMIILIFALSSQTLSGMAMENSRKLSYCTGNECNGYLPGYWGCDVNPTTVSSRYILLPTNVGYTELRYQTNCKAFWSRTTLTAGGYYIGATLDRQVQTPDFAISSSVKLGAGLSVYTFMGSSYDSSRTCGTANASNPVPAPVYTNCGIYMTKSN
jgi:hypothetical protein